MLARVIFCSAVVLATIAVIILAVVAQKAAKNTASSSWLALSLYIQQPLTADANSHPVTPSDASALIFHRTLTEGPENTSRVVGKAQGFIIPLENFADSAFNIIYLTFDTHQHSGSISIQAKNLADKDREQLTVVGGTGSFAFARGLAVFSQTNSQTLSTAAPYHIKLDLEFPNRSQTIQG